MSNATGTHDFVGHIILADAELCDPGLISNVIIKAVTERGLWIEELTSNIGPLRARFRSTYLHWAMAINGLYRANEYCKEKSASKSKTEFSVSSLRIKAGSKAGMEVIHTMSWSDAAEGYLKSVGKLATWGFIELFSALEDTVFSLYLLYLDRHRDGLLVGPDFRLERKLKRAAESATATQEEKDAWEEAWKIRIEKWRKKRLYDGLPRVFLSFLTRAGLKAPTKFVATTIESWAETIEGLALIRNLLIHGEQTVSKELSEICRKPYMLGFGFQEGEILKLELRHLMAFELFSDQLLDAINISASEHQDARK